MKAKGILITLAILVMIGFVFYSRMGGVSADELAPDFQTELIDGSSFSLSDLRGEYVLLDFWGSWCPPCRRDNPNLVKLYDEFGQTQFQDAKGFKVVTIALEKDNKRWERAASKDGFKWKHQIVDISRMVMLSSLAQKYGVTDVPSKFLIGPKGQIIGTNQSYDEIRNFLKAKI